MLDFSNPQKKTIISFFCIAFLLTTCKEKELDTTPPIITITQPANGATISNDVTIKVNATDNDAVSSVSFLIDGEVIGEDTESPYEYPWNVYFWADGNLHTILAEATDLSGNVGQSELISVEISEASINAIATGEDGQVIIEWEMIEGAQSYNIYYSESAGVSTGNGTKISDVTNPYTHSGLTNGTTYYYVVTAVFDFGESLQTSNELSAIPGIPPLAPQNVSASAGASELTISWDASESATTYNIYWSENSGVTIDTGTKISGVTRPYAHTGLTSGTYYYVVSAVNVYGESDLSNEVIATASAPSVPQNVSVLAEDRQMVINWNDAERVSTYNIYWSESPGVTKENGTKISNVTSPFIHAGSISGSTYYYVVTAQNIYDESDVSIEASATAFSVWTTKASMLTGRYKHTSNVVNGKIYVIGGRDANNNQLSLVEEYDPTTDIWSTKTPMPTGRSGHTSSVYNGKIYIFGGYDVQSSSEITWIEVYEPATDTWSTMTSFMQQGRSILTSKMVNGKIYVFAGYVNNEFTLVVDEYSPDTDTWLPKSTPTPDLFPRSQLTSSVIDGKIYIIGGDFGHLKVDVYDPLEDLWSIKTAYDYGDNTDAMSTAVFNNKIYFIGGFEFNSYLVGIPKMLEYDPITEMWNTRAQITTARGYIASVVINGKIYAIGGMNNSDPLSTVEKYDPALDQ